MIFTVEELESYNIEQLRNLAIYFSLDFTEKSSKGRLIDKIYRHLEKVNDVGERIDKDLPPASTRIQRIRESKKES